MGTGPTRRSEKKWGSTMSTMSKKLIRISALAAALTLTLAVPSYADESKGKSPNSSKSAKPKATSSSSTVGKVSNWILPKPETATYAIVVTPGSSIPIKFQLFSVPDSSTEIVGGSVVLTAETVTCLSLTNVPSPAPTPKNLLNNATPGKSPTGQARYLGKSWSAVWKLDKKAQGCFRLKATTGSLSVYSPTFVAYPKNKKE